MKSFLICMFAATTSVICQAENEDIQDLVKHFYFDKKKGCFKAMPNQKTLAELSGEAGKILQELKKKEECCWQDISGNIHQTYESITNPHVKTLLKDTFCQAIQSFRKKHQQFKKVIDNIYHTYFDVSPEKKNRFGWFVNIYKEYALRRVLDILKDFQRTRYPFQSRDTESLEGLVEIRFNQEDLFPHAAPTPGFFVQCNNQMVNYFEYENGVLIKNTVYESAAERLYDRHLNLLENTINLDFILPDPLEDILSHMHRSCGRPKPLQDSGPLPFFVTSLQEVFPQSTEITRNDIKELASCLTFSPKKKQYALQSALPKEVQMLEQHYDQVLQEIKGSEGKTMTSIHPATDMFIKIRGIFKEILEESSKKLALEKNRWQDAYGPFALILQKYALKSVIKEAVSFQKILQNMLLTMQKKKKNHTTQDKQIDPWLNDLHNTSLFFLQDEWKSPLGCSLEDILSYLRDHNGKLTTSDIENAPPAVNTLFKALSTP